VRPQSPSCRWISAVAGLVLNVRMSQGVEVSNLIGERECTGPCVVLSRE